MASLKPRPDSIESDPCPVALPATFTLESALGTRALAKLGVLPTRLTAVDKAASINVLCADKTGTFIQNVLAATTICPMPGFGEAHVLALAAAASSDRGWDPVAPTGCGVLSQRCEQYRSEIYGEEDHIHD